MKYNPQKIDLTKKAKQVQKVGYHKGTFITELDKVIDIIGNGGQVEMVSQQILANGAQVMTVNIYFVPNA